MRVKEFVGVLFVIGVCLNASAGMAAANLSTAEQDAIAAAIAKLHSPQERELASGWTDAKKVAEFICRPIALDQVKKWNKSADRIFLGTDDPATLQVASDGQLIGSGQVRTGNDWTDFTFSCEVDPGSGKATAFQTSLSANN